MAVYPHGLRTGLVTSLVGNISKSSPSCTPVSNGRTCSFSLAIPPGGPYDFVLATFDQPPSGGAVPGGAHQLGAALDTAKIAKGQNNALTFTIGGVVASTFMFVPLPSLFHAIASKSERLTIGARDSDGNVITTDGYVDAGGNTVTITPAADTSASATVTFAPAQFSAPQPNGVLLQYSALVATPTQIRNGFTTTITASASSGGTAATLTLAILAPSLVVDKLLSNPPEDVAVAAGRVFVTEPAGHALDLFSLDESGGISQPGSAPTGMAVDSASDVWFTDPGRDYLGELPSTTQLGFSVNFSAVALTSGTHPHRVANGPDGALWFTENGSNAIGRVAVANGVAGAVTEFPLPTASAGPEGIVTGPDQALWFTESNVGKIGRIPVNATPGSSAQITEYTLPEGKADAPFGIVSGSDGALWFTDDCNAYIGRMTTDGTVTHFSIPSGSAAYEIAVAPDGTMWFTEGIGKIGRILPSATPVSAGIIELNTFDSSSAPRGIFIDSEGAVYYVENAKTKLDAMK